MTIDCIKSISRHVEQDMSFHLKQVIEPVMSSTSSR